MKKPAISMLALAVVAGGALGASAASSTEGDTYQLNLRFAANDPLAFVVVNAVPLGAAALTISNANFQGVVDTDGSGKIEGAGFERIVYGVFAIVITTNPPPIGTVTNSVLLPTAYSDYNVSVSGKISVKYGLPNVQETLKGAGYSSTRANITLNGSDGTIVIVKSPTSGKSTFNVNYTANAPVVVVTNGVVQTTHLFGIYTGSIKPGIQQINNGKTISVNEWADLPVDVPTFTEANFQVVQFGNKFWANGTNDFFNAFNGSGNVNTGNNQFNASFKGLGPASGSNFKLNGTTGSLVIIINGVTYTVTTVSQAMLTGKFAGQSITKYGVISVPIAFP